MKCYLPWINIGFNRTASHRPKSIVFTCICFGLSFSNQFDFFIFLCLEFIKPILNQWKKNKPIARFLKVQFQPKNTTLVENGEFRHHVTNHTASFNNNNFQEKTDIVHSG